MVGYKGIMNTKGEIVLIMMLQETYNLATGLNGMTLSKGQHLSFNETSG